MLPDGPQHSLRQVTAPASVGTLGGMTPLALGALAAVLTLLASPLADPPARTPGAAGSPPPIGTPVTAASGGSGADWPVSPTQVISPFDDPLPYAAGHRGVDLAATSGQSVTASLPGRVAVAGYVAGRPLVVIEHENDLRTTYLPVLPTVSVGDHVRTGDPIGALWSSGSSEYWSGHWGLHWGARRGQSYIDPQSLLSSPAGPIVLLPEP